MKKVPFKSGIHPKENKEYSMNEKIKIIASDKIAVFPMSQHIGAPATPTVKIGDMVCVGTKIGEASSFVSSPVYSSVSGKVKAVEQRMLVGGRSSLCVVVENDFQNETAEGFGVPNDVEKLDGKAITKIITDAGIVGLGGAGFPAHVKLNVPPDKKIDTLIVNVAECEPYITSDHREALENGKNVLAGIYKIKEILGVHRVIIAIEDNKPDAIEALTRIADDPKMDPNDEVRVLKLHASYPQGAEKVLVQAATGRKVPAGGLPADVGCLVMNIGSVSFLASYMRTGMPLTMKRVTVDGSAVQNPQNVIVPIGTKIREVMEFCGGYKEEPQKLIMGGPMMGVAVTTDELPVLKQNNGLLAFGAEEARLLEPTDCIRCGRCVAACPMNLVPAKLEKYAERKDVEMLKKLDIMTCMECGCCAFSCPAKRRIVQAIRLGKYYVKKEAAKK